MIGCPVVQQDQIPGLDLAPAIRKPVRAYRGEAAAALTARPQHFLHHRRDEGGIRGKRFPLGGLVEEQERPVPMAVTVISCPANSRTPGSGSPTRGSG